MSWQYWSDNFYLYHSVTWILWLSGLALVFSPLLRERAADRPNASSVAHFSTVLFLLAVWLYIFSARWPALFGPGAYNPDEDQLLAAARSLNRDLVFFRSAECASSGPMNVYPLLLPCLAGYSPTFFTGRLVGLFMVAGSVSSLYVAAKAAFSEPVARACTFAVATLLGSTYFWDFRHFTSEHPPVFYLSVAWAAVAWLAVPGKIAPKWRAPAAAVAAVFISLVPLAKLQGIYLALFSGFLLLCALAFCPGNSARRRAFELGVAVIAALAVPAFFALLFQVCGVLEYAWSSYIGNALAYQGAGTPLLAKARFFCGMLANEGPLRATDLSLFVAGNLCAQLLLLLALLVPPRKPPGYLMPIFAAAGFVMFLVAAYTTTSTLRHFPHYLYFLPLPAAFVSSALLQCLWDRIGIPENPSNAAPWFRLCGLSIFLLIVAAPAAEFRRQHPHPHVGRARQWSETKQVSPIAKQIINAAAGGNQFLAVWGYNPRYYSETGLLSATRLSTSSAILNDNSLRGFFLKTYLNDLKANRPSVFVDAVAPGQFLLMTDPATQGHEQVPEIREFVEQNYTLVEEIEGVRIYRAKCW